MSPVISGQGVWKQCVCEVLRTPVWDLAGRPWPRLIFEQKVYWKVILCMWATDRLRVCTIRTQTHTIERECVCVCVCVWLPIATDDHTSSFCTYWTRPPAVMGHFQTAPISSNLPAVYPEPNTTYWHWQRVNLRRHGPQKSSHYCAEILLLMLHSVCQ